MKWVRRIAVVLLVAGVVFGLRMIPSPAPAQASCGGIPVLSQVCDALSGAWSFAVGLTKDQIQFDGKVVGWVSSKAGQFACNIASGKLPVGAGAVSKICDSIIGKLSGTKSTGTTSSSGSGGGGGSGSAASSSATAATPPQGTPAAALSTSSMAALGGAATLFVAHNISSATHVNVSSGWFPSMYSAITSISWELAAIAIILGAMLVMARAWLPSAPGEFAVLLARIPAAGILMIAVPVLTALAVGLVDGLCGSLMHAFHGGVTALHVLAAFLGILAGSSALAHLTHHATTAHVAGTGAWMLAGFGVVTTGAIALELIAREAAIFMSLLIVPLALVGEIFAPFQGWARGLMRALFVLVIAKFVLVLGLAMAGALVASLSVMNVILGLVTLLIIAFVPALIYGALIRVEQAFHAGMANAAISGPQLSMAGHVRATHQRMRERFSQQPAATTT